MNARDFIIDDVEVDDDDEDEDGYYEDEDVIGFDPREREEAERFMKEQEKGRQRKDKFA